ncbi:MAG TPA: hypothetical protein PLL06_19015 [Acidobacteriota bacterium]|nr:hypothetical protein [Acidobacteriota bacterium]
MKTSRQVFERAIIRDENATVPMRHARNEQIYILNLFAVEFQFTFGFFKQLPTLNIHRSSQNNIFQLGEPLVNVGRMSRDFSTIGNFPYGCLGHIHRVCGNFVERLNRFDFFRFAAAFLFVQTIHQI